MHRPDAPDVAQTLQNVLIERATSTTGDEHAYEDARDALSEDADLRDLLPAFVRTSRDLRQFWSYIQKFKTYRERREHIYEAFNPLFSYLDEGALPAQPEPPAPPPPKAQTPEPIPQRRKIRAFISYSTVDRAPAAAVKKALSTYGIECFLAHDDIDVSEEWKERILAELAACQIFVPLLSKAFKASDWASQEVGIAVARKDLAIVPLMLDGTNPYGFIAHVQGRRVPQTGIDPETVLGPLTRRFPDVMLPAMISRVEDAKTYRGGEAALRPLVPVFDKLDDQQLARLVRASVRNSQVWSAEKCRREYLPELIRLNGTRIDAGELEALNYQLLHDEWFRPENDPRVISMR